MHVVFDDDFDFVTSFETLVLYYSSRKLSIETDRLKAIAGLMKRLKLQKNGYFFEGLPLPLNRRLLFHIEKDKTISYVTRINSFPSWSWTGWTGTASWDIDPEIQLGQDWETRGNWIKYFYRSPTGALGDLDVEKGTIPYNLNTSLIEQRRDQFKEENFDYPIKNTSKVSPPGQPYWDEIQRPYTILQFWTVSVKFTLRKERQQTRYDVVDMNGSNCGYITSHYKIPELIPEAELILVSANYLLRENKWVEGYNVLLITWNREVAERRGIGVIERSALRRTRRTIPQWKHIVLA
jgi:hypothetical protein